MGLTVLDSLSHHCGGANDDRWGALPSDAKGRGAAWVIDGATSLQGTEGLPGPSPAAWFAEAVNRHLLALVPQDQPLAALLPAVGARVRTDFRRDAGRDLKAGEEPPAASLVLLRHDANGLEALNLGDCALLYRHRDGSVRRFGSCAVGPFEDKWLAIMKEMRAAGAGNDAVMAAVWAQVRENRGWSNREGGYWVMDLTERWHGREQIGQLDAALNVSPGGAALLMSDGYYRLVDHYGRYDDESLLAAAGRHGLAALYDELRQIEAEDAETLRYPRIKARDDATAVLLQVV